MKRFLLFFFSLCLLFCSAMPAYADGDPNIDTGGSGMGNGSKGNIWYGDSGVRVTIVHEESRTPAANSIDLIKPPKYALSWYAGYIIHFGKTSKVEYTAGTALAAQVGGYDYIIPAQTLPKIIATNSGTGNITAIRRYFCDEQVLRGKQTAPGRRLLPGIHQAGGPDKQLRGPKRILHGQDHVQPGVDHGGHLRR